MTDHPIHTETPEDIERHRVDELWHRVGMLESAVKRLERVTGITEAHAEQRGNDIRLVLSALRAVSIEATRRSGGLVTDDRAVKVALLNEGMPEAVGVYERLVEMFG